LLRKKLARAVGYVQDQLDADLTVFGIAQAVGLSPDHFSRLFKESTGQSPHRYVVEARVRKAKELLTTGKFTISEAAFMSVSSIRAILRVISKEFSAYLLRGC
jgi:AraC family transcriptional regulator